MSIIRIKKKDRFVVIDKKPIEDVKLSWQAKGLLTYLLSKPDDWRVHINQLSNSSTNGRDSTRRAVQELIDRGYITREMERNEKGHIVGANYVVSESADEKPCLKQDKPFTGKPTTDKPTTENRTLLNKDLLNNDNKENSQVELDGAPSSEEIREEVKSIHRNKHCEDTEKGDRVEEREIKVIKEEKETDKVSPAQKKHQEELDFVAEVMSYLNLKSGKKMEPDSKNAQKHIIPRMKKYKFIQFKAIIDHKCNDWADPSKEIRGHAASFYLRPETLFSAENFEKYLEEARHAYKLNHEKKKSTSKKRPFMTADEQRAELYGPLKEHQS